MCDQRLSPLMLHESGDLLGDNQEFIADEEATHLRTESTPKVTKKRSKDLTITAHESEKTTSRPEKRLKMKETWKDQRNKKEETRRVQHERFLDSLSEQATYFNQVYSQVMNLSELEKEERALKRKCNNDIIL
jgi:hypothetical protein